MPSSSTSITTRAVLTPAADHDRPRTDLARQAVLDGVFDERLQNHARNDELDRVWADLLANTQLRPEPYDFDVEVFVDRFEFFAQRDEVLVAAKQPAQEPGQLD